MSQLDENISPDTSPENTQEPNTPQDGPQTPSNEPNDSLAPQCDYEGLTDELEQNGAAFAASIEKAMTVMKTVCGALKPYRLLCSLQVRKIVDAVNDLPESGE